MHWVWVTDTFDGSRLLVNMEQATRMLRIPVRVGEGDKARMVHATNIGEGIFYGRTVIKETIEELLDLRAVKVGRSTTLSVCSRMPLQKLSRKFSTPNMALPFMRRAQTQRKFSTPPMGPPFMRAQLSRWRQFRVRIPRRAQAQSMDRLVA